MVFQYITFFVFFIIDDDKVIYLEERLCISTLPLYGHHKEFTRRRKLNKDEGRTERKLATGPT